MRLLIFSSSSFYSTGDLLADSVAISKSVVECSCVFCSDGLAFKKKDKPATITSTGGNKIVMIRVFSCFDCKKRFFKFLKDEVDND